MFNDLPLLLILPALLAVLLLKGIFVLLIVYWNKLFSMDVNEIVLYFSIFVSICVSIWIVAMIKEINS
jgi:hypothetical protein